MAAVDRGAHSTPSAAQPLRRLAARASTYTVGSVLQRVPAFLLIPLYTHWLTTADYGLVALATLTLPILNGLSGLGLPAAAFWACSRAPRDPALPVTLSTIAVTLTATSIACTALTLALGRWLVSPWLDPQTFASVIEPAAIAACMSNLPLLAIAVFQGLHAPRAYMTAVVCQGVVVQGACAVALVFVRADATAYAYGLLAGHAALACAYFVYLLRRFGAAFDWRVAVASLGFGAPLAAHQLNHWALAYLDRAMLEGFGHPRGEIGRYMLGYQIASVGQLAMIAVATAVMPAFQHIAGTGGPDARRHLGAVATVLVCTTSALGLGTIVLGGEAVRLMAPAEYHAATAFVPWVGLAGVLYGSYLPAVSSLNANRRTRSIPIASAAAALANAALNVLLIPRFGALGAAWATVAAYGLLLVLTQSFALREGVPVDYPWRLMVSTGAAGCVVALATSFLDTLDALPRLVSKGLLGSLGIGALAIVGWPCLQTARDALWGVDDSADVVPTPAEPRGP